MTKPDPRLIEILACPQDKGPLYYFEEDQFLYNPRLQLRYEIRDGIPVMLVEKATELSKSEDKELMARVEADELTLNFEAN